jgi:hypothetical protein
MVISINGRYIYRTNVRPVSSPLRWLKHVVCEQLPWVMFLFQTVIMLGRGIVWRTGGPLARRVIHQLKCLVGVDRGYVIYCRGSGILNGGEWWYVLNNFCGPSYVSLEVLSMKSINLQMLSNLLKEIIETKMGMAASWSFEKYELGLFTVRIKMRSARTLYIVRTSDVGDYINFW